MTNFINTRWLDSAEQLTWRSWLFSGLMALEGIDQDLLADKGIDLLAYHILVQTTERPGLRSADLAVAILASKQRVSQRIKNLVSDGLLETRPIEGDRRAFGLYATPKGAELLASAAPGHVESVRSRVIDVLDKEEVEILGRISQKILAANI